MSEGRGAGALAPEITRIYILVRVHTFISSEHSDLLAASYVHNRSTHACGFSESAERASSETVPKTGVGLMVVQITGIFI